MTTEAFFTELQTNQVSLYISQLNAFAGAIAQLFHILGFLLILTAVLIVNLRLVGLGLRKQPIPYLAKVTNPLILTGLALVAISGLFILLPSASLYYPNPAFWLKFYLLAAVLVVHFTITRLVTRKENPKPVVAISAAILSLTLWFGVAFAGRAIGFLN